MLIKLDSDCRRQQRRLQRRKRHEGSGKIVAEVISSGKRLVLPFGIKKEYFRAPLFNFQGRCHLKTTFELEICRVLTLGD
jgi:hypothetical protein